MGHLYTIDHATDNAPHKEPCARKGVPGAAVTAKHWEVQLLVLIRLARFQRGLQCQQCIRGSTAAPLLALMVSVADENSYAVQQHYVLPCLSPD